jgi:hypothetical protein
MLKAEYAKIVSKRKYMQTLLFETSSKLEIKRTNAIAYMF